MNREDIKIGGYYVATIDSGDDWIINVTDIKRTSIFSNGAICNGDEFYDGDEEWSDMDNITNVREATRAEIAHLNACIEEGEYIEAPEIDNYEIY